MNVLHSTTLLSEMRTDGELARKWNSINWESVTESVNRLQTRIAKAVQKEKWNLVKHRFRTQTNAWSISDERFHYTKRVQAVP